MRLGLAALAAGALLASSCAGSSPAPPPPPACAAAPRPAVPTAIQLAAPPPQSRALCIGRRYAAVFALGTGWGAIPKVMRGENANLQVWAARSLLYACDGCDDTMFSTQWVERTHPSWIMHTDSGNDIEPLDHPGYTLLDFTNLDYLVAWETRVAALLGHEGFTGVDVIDATNNPLWNGVPLVQNSDIKHLYMTESSRRRQLARALAVVRAPLLSDGYLLAAENGPPSEVVPNQINSTDAVSVGDGFATRAGVAWDELFAYMHQAFTERVGTIVWDTGRRLTQSQRVYGLASFLLVATPLASYGVDDTTDRLYQTSLGSLDAGEPTQVGDAWMRTYSKGEVAVNPGPLPASVDLGGGNVSLPPGGAAIAASGHALIRSW